MVVTKYLTVLSGKYPANLYRILDSAGCLNFTGYRYPDPAHPYRTVWFRWLCRCIAPPTFENIDNELSVDSIARSSQVVPPRPSVQNRNNTVPVLRYFSPGFQIKVLVCITSSGAGKIPIHSISMCN